MKKYILSLLGAFIIFGCDDSDDNDFLDTEPQEDVSFDQIQGIIKNFPEKAFSLTAGVEAGNNNYLISFDTNGNGAHDDFGYMSIIFGLEHMTNDLVMVNSHWFATYYRYLANDVSNSRNRMIWNFNYKVIYNMNQILQLLPSEATDDESKFLKGRAMAMRASAYLDLVRLYSKNGNGIPYKAFGNVDIDSDARVPESEVYQYIEDDLLTAYDLLQGYARPSKEYLDANVVAGFLARMYLSKGDYTKAAQYANAARAGYAPMNESDLADGFQFISNPEWMWGADINGSTATAYASFFSHMSNLNDGYAGLLGIYRAIDKRLYDEISDTDLRKEWFLGESDGTMPKYANVKFYDNTFFEGDYLFMRAAEFYFVEAEALALSGNEGQAKQVLFEIMSARDPQYQLSSATGDDLLEEIRINKRIELWGEGRAFFDMKRTNTPLVRDYPGSNHPSFGKFNLPAGSPEFDFDIPQAELDTNPSVSN